jgi:hypothetical protein
MIICSVCNTENDTYSTICRKCGGFLQNRIPNLDLFDTLWRVIENPRNAFRLITLAEHKNYAFFLYALCGISITFTGFWHFRLGERFENIFPLILWALLIGIPLGIVLCPLVASIHWILSKIFGGKASFRTSLGVTSYAWTPIVISMLLVLPIKLLTFGMYLFTFNPNPMAIKPASYVLLIGFDIILAVWTFFLTIIGTNIGMQVPYGKSISITAILYAITLGGLAAGSEWVLKVSP